MVICVIVINAIVSVTCLYLAVKLWKLAKTIDKAADAILRADRGTYNVLHNAPRAISKGETGTRNMRQKYQKLQRQVQTIRQVISVLTFLGKFTGSWRAKTRF